MRAIFSLAIVLLALTLALENAQYLLPDPAHHGAGADRALEIVAAAKGPLLPPAAVGGGPERIGQAIRLGDRTLVGYGSRGLHAGFAGPSSEFLGERWFDVATSLDDVRALATRVSEARSGELIVLASAGRLEPAGAEAATLSRTLAETLATLGARARPGTHTPESWALITLRRPHGWVPLAEAYSQESGVLLSFLLARELERYDDFQGDFAEVRAPAETQIFLEEELASASHLDPGTELARDREVGGRPLAGIIEPTLSADGSLDGVARASSLVWNDVELGPGSGLLALVGLADDAQEGSDGVVFEVRVDGVTVASHEVVPGAPWKLLQVDLRPFVGRKVALELRVDPRASSVGDAAVWGRPRLVHGYERSPLEGR